MPDEGACEPELVAVLATWIMEVEEDGVVSETIPSTSRAIVSRVSDVSKNDRVALFHVSRGRGVLMVDQSGRRNSFLGE
jgi:hypothetical protein